MTERTFRRWSTRYEAEGVEGLADRRIGRASARAVPVDEALQMVMLYESRYTGWTVSHFHERWQAEYGGAAVLHLDQEPATGRRSRDTGTLTPVVNSGRHE